jgi:hypothetical protein
MVEVDPHAKPLDFNIFDIKEVTQFKTFYDQNQAQQESSTPTVARLFGAALDLVKK